MPMIKKSAPIADKAEEAKPESGATAAIERLNKPAEKPSYAGKVSNEQRDFKKEAEGKVKCVMFEAALQSPAIAGLRFDSLEEFLKLVEKAADAGVAYTWK